VPIAYLLQVDTVRSDHPEREVKVYFDQEGVTDIAARTEYDRYSNPPTAIPSVTDREAYHRFMRRQVENVSQGRPAVLPGYANMYAISNQQPYAEIIGRESTRDWQDMNLMDDRMGATDEHTSFHRGDFDLPVLMAPNPPDQNERLLEQLQSRLPNYSSDRDWNRAGPYQSVSLEFMAFDTSVTKTGTRITPRPTPNAAGEFPIPADMQNNDDHRSFYHSVEAYAVKTRPDGAVDVCLSNPNDTASTNSDCNNFMTIPAPDSSGRRLGRIIYPEEPNLQMGRVELQPASDAYQSQMTSSLISYCRQKNRGRSNCPGGN
jgi:hypothetical protein